MFFLGLELDLEQIKSNWKTTVPLAAVSIIIPGKTKTNQRINVT